MILVTGGTGMIGRALTSLFLQEKKSLRAQVRNQSVLKAVLSGEANGDLQVKEADFEQVSEVKLHELVRGCRAVVHTAGLVHQPDAPYQSYELLNVRTTQQLAETAAAEGVDTFVFLSTIAVYGPKPKEDVAEEDALNPVTPYAVSKAKSESWLREFTGIPRVIVLRPALVFGEGDRGNVIKLIQQIEKKRYFNIGRGEARKSLIYSRDLAHAISLCLEKTGPGYHVFNAANLSPVSVFELTRQISTALGKEGNIASVPDYLVRAGASLAELVLKDKSPLKLEHVEKLTSSTSCSVKRLKETVDFAPTYSIADALNNEIRWARSSGII